MLYRIKQVLQKGMRLGLGSSAILAFLYTGSTLANAPLSTQTGINLQNVAQNATENLSATAIIFVVITVLVSIGLFVSGLMGLHKVISQGHSSQMSIATPLTKIGISALLLFSLYLANVLDTSLFGTGDSGMSDLNVIKQSGYDNNAAGL